MGHQVVARMQWSDTVLDVAVPPELSAVTDAIEKSRAILQLKDNWDGEGSSGYTEDTWNQAAQFLFENALRLWNERGIAVSAPAIYNGPEGSIDIYWGALDRKLLINIPANSEEPATFYGQDSSDHEIKGNLRLSDKNEWLMMWQME